MPIMSAFMTPDQAISLTATLPLIHTRVGAVFTSVKVSKSICTMCVVSSRPFDAGPPP
jgi:hypothetical protein